MPSNIIAEPAQPLATNLFSAGLELMLAGMGTVFVFLTLLVAATAAMSALVRRFSPLEQLSGSGQGDAPTAEE